MFDTVVYILLSTAGLYAAVIVREIAATVRWNTASGSELGGFEECPGEKAVADSPRAFVQGLGVFRTRWLVSSTAMDTLAREEIELLFGRALLHEKHGFGRYERLAMIAPYPLTVAVATEIGIPAVALIGGAAFYYLVVYPYVERRLAFRLDRHVAETYGTDEYEAVLRKCVESGADSGGLAAYLFSSYESRLKRLEG